MSAHTQEPNWDEIQGPLPLPWKASTYTQEPNWDEIQETLLIAFNTLKPVIDNGHIGNTKEYGDLAARLAEAMVKVSAERRATEPPSRKKMLADRL